MTKIEFTAQDTAEDKKFVCGRCSGQVIKLAEKQYARQRPLRQGMQEVRSGVWWMGNE